MTDHAAFMRRAVALVRDTQHRTSPNPTVGCVIVRAGVIVGEGVTRPVGQAHAEVVAIEAAGAAARGADMYVTLEPCSHHGRTPPCTQAILAAGLRSVFVGVEDPNPLVNGLGVGQLRAAGVPTEVGILAEPCARLAEPFRRFILDRRPWVLLKAAVTLDGRIAAASGDSKWITGEEARAAAHGLRARADAVLVGLGTAQADDPRLDVRLARGEDPLRVLLDSRAALDPRARMLGPGALVFHGEGAHPARVAALAATGAHTHAIPRVAAGLDVAAALEALAVRGVVRLLVEGGGRVHASLLGARLADEACFFVAPRLVGRGRPVIDLPSAPTVAQGWSLEGPEIEVLGPDVRIQGRIRYPAPSEAEGS